MTAIIRDTEPNCRSLLDGVVVFIDESRIVVKSKTYTIRDYRNIKTPLVEVGQEVKKGEILGWRDILGLI